jgi:uncharacterized protein YndB with AHSA1/START domain
MTDARYVLERVFSAPLETLWRTWTDPTLFVRWYKPVATCETAVLQHDLRPGGVMLYEMRFGEMPPSHERWVFDVIEPPRRLVWKQMITDAEGNVVGNPRMPDWPRVMETSIELEAHAEGTMQRLTWRPYEATEAELACFEGASKMLGRGWAGGFESLAALIEALKAE